jgi:hypothetical protein
MVEGDAEWFDPVAPDAPHSRGGRSLGEWLLELAEDDFARRRAAGDAILSIAQPWRSMNPTTAEQLDEYQRLLKEGESFAGVLRRAVDEPSFPKAQFVRALCEYKVAVQVSWEQRVTRKLDREERVADKVVERFRAAPSAPGAEETFHRRLARVYFGTREDDHEASSSASSAAYVVFNALDDAFLAAPDALALVLRQKVLASSAAEALERIGPAAKEPFGRILLDMLDAADERHAFHYANALAAVCREDPELVDALVGRALEAPWAVAEGAIEALGAIGPTLLERTPDLLARLLRRQTPELSYPVALMRAAGRIGRDDAGLLATLLDYARPRPPRIIKAEGGFDWDATLSERGAALESLGNFTRFPDRVVPVLADALETFEEYDPDWGYERGDHGRVVASLRAFGPAAAAAVPALTRRVKDRDGAWDREVIRLLGDIGPPAADALPALEQLYAEDGEPPIVDTPPGEEPDRTFDVVAWALWRIRGGAGG